MVVLDEPDAALHATAERHAVNGLALLADAFDAKILVATHSREFLNQQHVLLQHVSRDMNERVTRSEMRSVQRERCADLGLAPADLLLLSRAILVVEGEHDVAVVDELIGDSLRELGVLVIPMHGGRRLPSVVDAELLALLTDVPVIAVLDNLSAQAAERYWRDLLNASEGGQRAFDEITDRFIQERVLDKKRSEHSFSSTTAEQRHWRDSSIDSEPSA